MKINSDRELIIPDSMRNIVERAGYVPAVRSGNLVFCAGQIGRTSDLVIVEDPEEQFRTLWANLELVLGAAGCSFDDVVEMTSYHVNMREHMPTFVKVKDQVFPKGTSAWTCLGVSELAHDGLLAEVKVVAIAKE